MAKYTDAKCRLCRREGVKLYLKGVRCFSPKCPIERGAQIPGQHGKKQGRPRLSGLWCSAAKSKAKRSYGVLESQFRNIMKKPPEVPETLAKLFFRFLKPDWTTLSFFRLGFTGSRSLARQLVNHGNVTVNGKKLDIPSYQVKPGEVVSLVLKVPNSVFVAESLAQKTDNAQLVITSGNCRKD